MSGLTGRLQISTAFLRRRAIRTLRLIADGVDLATVKLATIKAEMARLEKFISADTVVRNQYTALSSRIAQENTALKALETRLTDAQGAMARRKALQTEREASYGRLFDAIVSEENELIALYAPLMARLAVSSGTLRKLSFSVSRVVDADAWGGFAEDKLIDCRERAVLRPRFADQAREVSN